MGVNLLVEVVVHSRSIVCINNREVASSDPVLFANLFGLVVLGDFSVRRNTTPVPKLLKISRLN